MKNDFNIFPELKSERVHLKKLDFNHTNALYEYQSNKENFIYVDMPVYKSIDEAKEYIQKMNEGVNENRWIIWAICKKESNEIIGTISIWNLDSKLNKAELGYGIFPAFRRKGYMCEAVNLALQYAFNDMELSIIEAYTSHNNKPSICFLKNMNFNYVNTVEDEYSDGALMDIFQIDISKFTSI